MTPPHHPTPQDPTVTGSRPQLPPRSTEDVVRTFVDYYRSLGHEPVQGSNLIPPPGDRVLFTTSGMHPLTPYLEGVPHPQGRRLVNVQRCLRTTDLDEVGDQTHLTVFRMLGTWSLGDYGGPSSLRWGYQLLRDGFGIDPNLLHVTVFGGNDDCDPDRESWSMWSELGVPVEPTGHDNWWSNGPVGPCGPDTEIFLWTGREQPQGTPTSDPRWVEIWNHVMMRYRRHPDGSLEPLRQRNVDTGMGLERLVGLLTGHSVFSSDQLSPWMDTVDGLWSLPPDSQRLVSDHLRSGVVVIGDGVQPSNTGRGYVLRRLVRRTLTVLWDGDSGRSLEDVPLPLIEQTLRQFGQGGDPLPVREQMVSEQRRFRELVRRGRPVVDRLRSRGPLSVDDYQWLRETHGLPRELVDQWVG